MSKKLISNGETGYNSRQVDLIMGKSILNKKILITLSIILLNVIPCYAKDFVINVKEKVDYINIQYFDKFNDANLTNYILKSIEHNHNARIASYQVEEYHQAMKSSFGAELPSLSGAVNYLGLKTPEFAKTDIDKNILVLPFVARYEADIFLKNRDKTKATKKAQEYSKEREKATYIVLASDVATTYLNILAFDKKVSIQKEIINSQRGISSRTQKKFNQGTVDAMTLNNIVKSLKQAENDLSALLISQQKLLTQLTILIGDSPHNIQNLKFGKFDEFGTKLKTPDIIISDVIYSRPDVLAVEKKLEKAKIEVRIARKEFLPSFNIIGVYAFNSLGAGSFFSWESAFAALMAGATQDIFMGGRKIANLKIQKSKYEQIFEEYKQVDLMALKEVNDALYIIKYDSKIEEKTFAQLSLTDDNYQRNVKKYKQGVISYPALLEEKVSLLNIEQTHINTRVNKLIDYFTLYKAVGGKL